MTNNPLKPNPYLTYLTGGEKNLDWLWKLSRRCLYLWIPSSLLILMFFPYTLDSKTNLTFICCLPFWVPTMIILIVGILLLGTRLTLTETQKNLFSLLVLTNITSDAVFWNLLLAVVYRTRRWLLLLIGMFPFFIWCICRVYTDFAHKFNSSNFVSLLGHTYEHIFLGPTNPSSGGPLEIFWFLSVTIGVLGVTLCALFCCVGAARKNKNAFADSIVILLLTVTLIMVIAVIIAPEGALLIETQGGPIEPIAQQVLNAGILVAALPCIAAFVAQQLLRRWVLD